MIPLAIAMRVSCPIFRSIFVKIAWEIAIPYSGSGPGCREREYMGKTRGAHKWNHIERETGLLARGALTLAANTAGV